MALLTYNQGFSIEKSLRRAKGLAGGIFRSLAAVQGIEKGPDYVSLDYIQWVNAAGTGLVSGLGLDANDNLVFSQAPKNMLSVLAVSVTLAQIKAGTAVIVPAITGKKVRVFDFDLLFAGAAATATTIRLSDTNSSPVDVAVVPVALAADASRLTRIGTITSIGGVNGAGANSLVIQNLGVALTAGKGVQIRDVTANTLTGTTGVTGWIAFDYTN